jgi:hypothetical protein
LARATPSVRWGGEVAEEGEEFDDREVVLAGSLNLPILRTLAITCPQ